MKKVVVIGPFRGRVNGLAKNTRLIVDELARFVEVVPIDVSPKLEKTRNIRHHINRLLAFFRSIRSLIFDVTGRETVFYITADGGFGKVYNFIHLFFAVMNSSDVYYQHRSFSYINNHSILMNIIQTTLGRAITNIFLCDCMAEKFNNLYRGAAAYRVISNAAMTPSRNNTDSGGREVKCLEKKKDIIIGFLSNLTSSKGIYDFIDLIYIIEDRALSDNVRYLIAGPCDDSRVEAEIDLLRKRVSRVDYIGAVYGEEKWEFYEGLDIFVFPTKHPDEAEPNVIFEAMSRGSAIVSYDRGCISEMLQGTENLIVDEIGQFGAIAATQILGWMSDSERLASTQEQTLRRFEDLHRSATMAFNDFLKEMAS